MQNQDEASDFDIGSMTEVSKTTRLALLNRVKNPNDWKAWSKFFLKYNEPIRGYARSYCVANSLKLNSTDIEEVVQNVLIQASRNVGDFVYDPDKGNFRSFLAKIAYNQCISLLRKKMCRPDWDAEGVPEDPDAARNTAPIDRFPEMDPDEFAILAKQHQACKHPSPRRPPPGDITKIIEENDLTVGRALALEILRGDRNVTRHKYSIFEKVVLGVPVADICAQFDVLPGVVYTTKSLVMPYYEKALHKAKAELDEPTELPPAF